MDWVKFHSTLQCKIYRFLAWLNGNKDFNPGKSIGGEGELQGYKNLIKCFLSWQISDKKEPKFIDIEPPDVSYLNINPDMKQRLLAILQGDEDGNK
jgi:hypothetical protein